MDNQHTVLFGLLNDLHAAMMKGQAQNLTGPLLGKLVDYTRTHFAEEEKLMTAAKYPGLNKHKNQHREMNDLAASGEVS
jgi:hemerythrin